MSDEAFEFMTELSEQYALRKAEIPNFNHRVWKFAEGKRGGVYEELRLKGIITWMGARGAPYVLTPEGHSWLVSNFEV